MELTGNYKWLILLVILILAIFLALPFFTAEKGINKSEFEQILSSKQEIAIVMDIRQAPAGTSARQKIFQCGADLAGSTALVGKDMRIVSFEGDRCIFLQGTEVANISIAQCEKDTLAGRVRLEVAYGNNTTLFYPGRAKIFLNENYAGPCAALEVQ